VFGAVGVGKRERRDGVAELQGGSRHALSLEKGRCDPSILQPLGRT
jgi:hypothetical protein